MTVNQQTFGSLGGCPPLDPPLVKINECPQGSFKSMDELRDFMAKNIPSTCNVEDIGAVEMGYIEPGHGSKGKKVWLCNDSDLWCFMVLY